MTAIPITFTYNGTTLGLNWGVTGWYLQAQTNSASVGLTNNWVDVPGSTGLTSTTITVDPKQPTVFYRLSSVP